MESVPCEGRLRPRPINHLADLVLVSTDFPRALRAAAAVEPEAEQLSRIKPANGRLAFTVVDDPKMPWTHEKADLGQPAIWRKSSNVVRRRRRNSRPTFTSNFAASCGCARRIDSYPDRSNS